MARLSFTEEERQAFKAERFAHPHPRVQKRMDVMWYLSLGETNANAARLAAVGHATVDRYIAIYREHGLEGLKRFDWCGRSSELLEHQASLEEMFRVDPPHTTAEACQRIQAATGVKRGLTQTRQFLKKIWG
ncbi:MAG: hypothetical protein R3C49_02710 [Planctomycetaceae bacterium]